MSDQPSTIVAEVSVNWTAGAEQSRSLFLAQRFEKVIAVNAGRGYRLDSWQLSRTHYPAFEGAVFVGTAINETIIAVFVVEPADSGVDARSFADLITEADIDFVEGREES